MDCLRRETDFFDGLAPLYFPPLRGEYCGPKVYPRKSKCSLRASRMNGMRSADRVMTVAVGQRSSSRHGQNTTRGLGAKSQSLEAERDDVTGVCLAQRLSREDV